MSPPSISSLCGVFKKVTGEVFPSHSEQAVWCSSFSVNEYGATNASKYSGGLGLFW